MSPEQNLDPYIGPIISEKLKEFPDGTVYEKKVGDMKFLTSIESKTKKGQNLSKDEITFLYEINAPIEGFGYKRDPRIDELRSQRNPEEDMPIFFECTTEEIARDINEINQNTKAYIGKLQSGIFTKFPENLEYIYTSFPEGKIHKEGMEIGGKTAQTLERELHEKGTLISSEGRDMLRSKDFTTLESPEEIELVRLEIPDLGLGKGVSIDEIYRRAEELGLELCPAEVAPRYRLKYTDQPFGEFCHVSTKQTTVPGGSEPDAFLLFRNREGFHLSSTRRPLSNEWSPGTLVFLLPKKLK